MVLPNIIRQCFKMKQQLIILWAFLALAHSAAIDTTISPFEIETDAEEITTFLPNYDDAEELTELDQEETTTSTTSTTTTTTTTTSTTTTIGPSMMPEITREPNMIQVFTINEPLVLECQAKSELPTDITYMWTKNGRPFSVDGQRVFSESKQNGNILFTSPQMSDVGTYQCEAMNEFGQVFSQASLLRAKQTRNQPRRLDFKAPTIQVLVDPVAEDKESIPRIPITEAVPEVLPTNLKPVFVVFPKTSEPEKNPATIMEMQIVNEDQDEAEYDDITESPDSTL